MDNIKELNKKSYSINSKHKKHTGKRAGCNQKSRSWHEDKSRDWRHKAKQDASQEVRRNIKNDITHKEFTANEKLYNTKKNIPLS
jgi:hypothetical protein